MVNVVLPMDHQQMPWVLDENRRQKIVKISKNKAQMQITYNLRLLKLQGVLEIQSNHMTSHLNYHNKPPNYSTIST